jgi:hypothetical protein
MNKSNKTFLQGDHVRYVGGKTFSNDDGTHLNLQGAVGEIVGRVQNTKEVVADFKGTAYVIDPNHLEHQAWNDADEKHNRALDRKWKVNDDQKKGKGKKQ